MTDNLRDTAISAVGLDWTLTVSGKVFDTFEPAHFLAMCSTKPISIATHLLVSAAFAWLLIVFPTRVSAEDENRPQLENAYLSDIRPLLERYCHDCHGTAGVVEGEIDLAKFSNLAEVSAHPATWQRVAEMLGNQLMPPPDAEQPTDAERARLQGWVNSYLAMAAKSHAGDPGAVVLRRLNNAEYTYTLRDLTGVDSLDPAREFPADGAAGEGFTNTGNSLVMSPELVTKYLDAAKEVASHAVLLPDGFRFSPHTTPRDWTDDTLAQIRSFYNQFTEAGGGSRVNLQGIVFETNQGGRLPVEKYLTATLVEREALTAGIKTVEQAARDQGLNEKYLGILWARLNGTEPSLLLDELRERWRKAKPEDAPALAADIAAWQKSLWNFASVGLIGRTNGPKRWMEPLNPLTTRQDFKFKFPETSDGEDVTISLATSDAGDGNDGDYVIWRSPRLVIPGQLDLLLRDVREVVCELRSRRDRLIANAAACLDAVDEISSSPKPLETAQVARQHGCDESDLRAWLDCLGFGASESLELDGLFTSKLNGVGGFEFVNGWGSSDTPLLLANSSNEHVRIPGSMKPHSVAVHPSPKLRTTVGWRSPITNTIHIEGTVTHAHPECGNGVTWTLEVRRGKTRQRLAAGTAQGATPARIGPFEGVNVRTGDYVLLSIGPRDVNHTCDLTAVDLEIVGGTGDAKRVWNLADDVSGDVLAGNPLADQHGNADVWYFFTEPDGDSKSGFVIPADSLLAKWQAAPTAEARHELARELQKLLMDRPSDAKDKPDAVLRRELISMRGPLLGGAVRPASKTDASVTEDRGIGLDPVLFGRHPNGRKLDAADLCVQAPALFAIHLPADLVAGAELVTTAELDQATGEKGSVQLGVAAGEQKLKNGLVPGEITVKIENGHWSASNQNVANSAPILVREGSATQKHFEAAFEAYRQLFPPSLCYTKIVPVDEVISVTLFHREDDHLVRLMLNDEQARHLDRLWEDLHFVSRDALTSVDAFAQLLEFATQDAEPKAFEPLRQPIHDRAAAFRQLLVDCEPVQINALVEFASLAYRRPLTSDEAAGLKTFYEKLRSDEIPHDEAFQLTLARVLVAPAFLYRLESPVAGIQQGAVNDWELASRLSYFLWSSAPDAELREAAADSRLHEPEVLIAQSRRMLKDVRVRRMATEFACHWLQIDNFERLDEKSERHFPTFADLRGAMAEESVQFFTHLFQHNGSVLDIIDADYTFLNGPLAQHYGIPDVTGDQWRRVDGVKMYSRGGVLAQATTLSKQSGASRTSPILRGNWVSEVLLGERLPKPPPGVPPLPNDEAATDGLTVRQLVEKHVSDPACSVCHRRFDPYGFSLEAFDAIGRHRTTDLGDRPIDTRVKTMDGAEFEGLDGLRNYLIEKRRADFVRQFCRKLLGYALGRAVQLSDQPLLTEVQDELAKRDYRVQAAVEAIVRSRQFREIRGTDSATSE